MRLHFMHSYVKERKSKFILGNLLRLTGGWSLECWVLLSAALGAGLGVLATEMQRTSNLR
jgi:hypothetical protein